MLKNTLISTTYKNIYKPLAFLRDAEKVHASVTTLGEFMGSYYLPRKLTSAVFSYERPGLEKEVYGISFKNPVGLAAGFDYDGHLASILPSVGFGFNTVGTVTALPYQGNDYPRLGRLPKSGSLFVNKGFKSQGADAVLKILRQKFVNQDGSLKDAGTSGGVLGVSVGSSNLPEIDSIDKAIKDYLCTFELFRDEPYVKYFELNISCPNTRMPESFTSPEAFEKLVVAVSELHLDQPIFVKMPSEIAFESAQKLIDVALKYGIKGFIFSNLVKSRENQDLNPDEVAQFADKKGNFSGIPVKRLSLELVRQARQHYGDKVVLVGCGGVFSAADACEYFEAGADLIQLISGLVFEGPQLVSEICEGLVTELS